MISFHEPETKKKTLQVSPRVRCTGERDASSLAPAKLQKTIVEVCYSVKLHIQLYLFTRLMSASQRNN